MKDKREWIFVAFFDWKKVFTCKERNWRGSVETVSFCYEIFMGKVTLQAIDFFCSGGGMSFGMQQAGVNVIAGIDYDPAGAGYKKIIINPYPTKKLTYAGAEYH